MNGRQPGGGIKRGGKRRKSRTRRLIATRKLALRALSVGMNQENLRDGTNLLPRLRMANQETFLGIRSTEACGTRRCVGPPGWADNRLETDREQISEEG
jgi:hypothetical protein